MRTWSCWVLLPVLLVGAREARAELPEERASDSRYELGGGIELGGGRASQTSLLSRTIGGWFLGAAAGLRVHTSPIVDDDAPRTLQPYLQRRSWLQAEVRGTTRTSDDGEVYAGESQAGLSVAGTFWASDRLELGARLAYTKVSQSLGLLAQKEVGLPARSNKGYHVIGPGASLGLRVGDTTVTGSYAINWSRSERSGDSFSVGDSWGIVGLEVFSVLAHRRFVLSLGGSLSHTTFATGVTLGWLLSRATDLSASFRGSVPIDEPYSRDLGTTLGIARWLFPALRANAAVGFDYSVRDGSGVSAPYSSWTLGVRVGLLARF